MLLFSAQAAILVANVQAYDRAQRLSAHGVVRPSELVDERVTMATLPAALTGAGHGGFKTVLDLPLP